LKEDFFSSTSKKKGKKSQDQNTDLLQERKSTLDSLKNFGKMNVSNRKRKKSTKKTRNVLKNLHKKKLNFLKIPRRSIKNSGESYKVNSL